MSSASFRKKLLAVYVALVFAFIYGPILVVLVLSFNEGKNTSSPWTGFTLNWFQAVFRDRPMVEAGFNSLYVGTGATIVALLLGVIASFIFIRRQFRAKSAFSLMIIAPFLIPGSLYGISLLMFFAQIGFDRSLVTIALSHAILITPLVFLLVSARLATFDRDLEQAAQDLGASRLAVMRYVTLPILTPTIIIAALLAFTWSFDEFIIAFFTAGSSNTLPLAIWSQLKYSLSNRLNALASLIFIFSFITAMAGAFVFSISSKKKRRVEEEI